MTLEYIVKNFYKCATCGQFLAGHMTGMSLLLPHCILQNPGKISILPILPLMAALLSGMIQIYLQSVTSTLVILQNYTCNSITDNTIFQSN